MRVLVWILVVAMSAAAACTKSGPLDDMQPGETGRVVRVIDGDALVLDTGQSVRLVGIEAPAPGRRNVEAQPYAEQSKRALEDLVMGRQVRLYYPGLTRDRYDRALAHVETTDGSGPKSWVNLELVKRGAARVRLYPDTDGGGEALLEAERDARASGSGLWGDAAYRPRAFGSYDPSTRGFILVEGQLGRAVDRPHEEERRTLCSREINDGLVIDIAFSARPLCDTPEGTRVRVRGWTNEKRMELVHPLHMEIMPEGKD